MVRHYHICVGQADSMPHSDFRFEDFEESIQCFVTTGNMLYSELRGSDYDLTIEQALEATNNGKGRGAYVGPPNLILYWLRCEDTHHETPSWN